MDWQKAVAILRQLDRAARKIQRCWRLARQPKQVLDLEDDLLETVWHDYKMDQKAVLATQAQVRQPNRSRSVNKSSVVRARNYESTRRPMNLSLNNKISPGRLDQLFGKTMPTPPVSKSVRSVCSENPYTRSKGVTRKEIDDDLRLEQAWIEMEIRQAREQRQGPRERLGRNHAKKSGTSRSTSSKLEDLYLEEAWIDLEVRLAQDSHQKENWTKQPIKRERQVLRRVSTSMLSTILQ
jgi:hypothetical protein